MNSKLAVAIAASALAWGAATSAAAQAADSVCLSLTERLRANAFVSGPGYGRIDFHYRMWLADRGPDARYVGGPDGLRAATFERLPVTCASAPRESLVFLVRAFAAAGDLDGALTAARRQVEIAGYAGALANAQRELAMVLVARGEEAEAAAVLRQTRADLSDAALLVDAYRAAAAGSMIFGYDTPAQMALLEGAARNGRLRLTQPRKEWETAEEELGQTLTELGERRRHRGELDQALAVYGEAATLLTSRAERLRGDRPQGWQTALVGVEDLLLEAHAGLTESAASKGDRARTLKAAQAGTAVFAGQAFATPGSGLQGQVAAHRFSGDPTARPAARRLGRMADALLVVGETGFAVELYDAVVRVFAEDPSRGGDLGEAYTRLATARRLGGDLAGAGEAVEQGEQAIERARAAERRAGSYFLATELSGARLERAQVQAAGGDRAGACRTVTEAAGLLPPNSAFPEAAKMVAAIAAARSELCAAG